jgi:hypothetical protein
MGISDIIKGYQLSSRPFVFPFVVKAWDGPRADDSPSTGLLNAP